MLFLAAGTTLGFGVLTVVPAWMRWGDGVLVQAGGAMALCLPPALAALGAIGWATERSAMHQLAALVLGTGLRMFAVLGGGLAIYFVVPGCRGGAFWAWVLVFYLFTLFLEIVLVLRSQPGGLEST